MSDEELRKLESSKRRNFNRVFGTQYGIKLLMLQAHSNPDGQKFVDLDFLFGPRMTVEAVGMMCDKIAEWVGGEVRGTVNIDFAGKPSLSIVVELPSEE